MNQSILKRLLLGAALMSTSGVGNAVFAASDDQAQLEEVIVVAQKRPENLQDVPISMTVLSTQKLESLDLNTIQELQNYVPNLLVQSATVPNQYFIRGFGSQAANDAFEQSVSVYVDGIYGGRNRQFMVPFFDVDQVEVLRGPQGALLGKNTAAGAIVITDAKPTDTFQAGEILSYNFSFGGPDFFGFLSGPLTDSLNGRLAVHYDDIPGWVHNTGTGTYDPDNTTKQVRPSLEFKPSDGIDIIAKFDYSQVYNTGNNLVQTSTTTVTLTTTKNEPTPFGIPEVDRTNSQNASILGRFALGGIGTLETISGYSAYSNTYNLGALAGAPEAFVVGFISDFSQYSQEVRLLSPTNQTIEYIVGAYFDTANFSTKNTSTYNFGGGFAGAVQTAYSQNAKTWSGFAQATWHVVDNLRVLGSVRYTHEPKDAYFDEVTLNGIPIATAAPLTGSESEDHTDPSVTIQYDLMPNVMLYALFSQGSKGGGFVSNTRTVTAADFQYAPEKSQSYEVGVKSTFLDKRLLVDVDLYDTKFTNLQVTTFDPALLTYITGNAASATSKGVEWSTAYIISPNWRISTAGAYLDATYNNFPGAQCLATTPPADCSAAGTTNLAGTTLLGASKWTGNGELDFNHPLTSEWNLTAAAIATHRSGYFVSADQSPIYGYQSSFTKYDANISVIRGAWTISLIGKNLSNKLTKSFAYDFAGTGVADVDPTRQFILQARARF
jgi:iron complex outermembrane receptor protein